MLVAIATEIVLITQMYSKESEIHIDYQEWFLLTLK